MTGMCRAALVAVLMATVSPALGTTTKPGGGITAQQQIRRFVRARINTPYAAVRAGQPVMVEFLLENTADEPVTLMAPGPREAARRRDVAVGLPIEHVFSGPGHRALEIFKIPPKRASQISTTTTSKPVRVDLAKSVSLASGAAGAAMVLGPKALVGVNMEVSRYYPVLLQPGRYRLRWRPYDGTVASNTLELTVKGKPAAVIETNLGRMRLELFEDKAPKHVANFIELVEAGFYDSQPDKGKWMTFHRVVPGFLIQGGSPDGTSAGRGPRTVPAEFNDLRHRKGMVGAARTSDDPDSASCQFYICLKDLPELDYRWTLFGELVGEESFQTLKRISQVELTEDPLTKERSRPRKPVIIKRIWLQQQ